MGKCCPSCFIPFSHTVNHANTCNIASSSLVRRGPCAIKLHLNGEAVMHHFLTSTFLSKCPVSYFPDWPPTSTGYLRFWLFLAPPIDSERSRIFDFFHIIIQLSSECYWITCESHSGKSSSWAETPEVKLILAEPLCKLTGLILNPTSGFALWSSSFCLKRISNNFNYVIRISISILYRIENMTNEDNTRVDGHVCDLLRDWRNRLLSSNWIGR